MVMNTAWLRIKGIFSRIFRFCFLYNFLSNELWIHTESVIIHSGNTLLIYAMYIIQDAKLTFDKIIYEHASQNVKTIPIRYSIVFPEY